jgi:hypothetical protein
VRIKTNLACRKECVGPEYGGGGYVEGCKDRVIRREKERLLRDEIKKGKLK